MSTLIWWDCFSAELRQSNKSRRTFYLTKSQEMDYYVDYFYMRNLMKVEHIFIEECGPLNRFKRALTVLVYVGKVGRKFGENERRDSNKNVA